VSGDTVVVGAHGEDSSATGVNGYQSNNSVESAGAAYIFVRSGSDWSQQAYLKASNTDAGDFFGGSVAVSGDTVVVGANSEASNATGVNGTQSDNSLPGAGAAYVFVREGTTWSQQAYLKASNTDEWDTFGGHVAVSGDTVVVGAYLEQSNATGVNGDQSDNSLGWPGAAYVFVRTGTVWSQQAYLKASNTDGHDSFGWSVAVSGDTIVVGAIGEDSNATGVNGNQSDNSADKAGAVYVFVRSGTSWSQRAYLKASNTDAYDKFGWSTAMSGDSVVVGAWGECSSATGTNGNQSNNSLSCAGAAYVFVQGGTDWSQEAYLKASNSDFNDRFGQKVAISGDTVVVGTSLEESSATGVNGDQSDNSVEWAGAAYVFVRTGTAWIQQAYLKASNTDWHDSFGSSVAVSGDTVVIGALGESSSATGINSDQIDNSAGSAGAVYVFRPSYGYVYLGDTGTIPLQGVTITAWDIQTGLSESVQTSEDGHYVLPELPEGTYRIEAELSYFDPGGAETVPSLKAYPGRDPFRTYYFDGINPPEIDDIVLPWPVVLQAGLWGRSTDSGWIHGSWDYAFEFLNHDPKTDTRKQICDPPLPAFMTFRMPNESEAVGGYDNGPLANHYMNAWRLKNWIAQTVVPVLSEFVPDEHLDSIAYSFIGHSMGGIIVRGLVESGLAPMVNRVVSLDGVHGGTSLGLFHLSERYMNGTDDDCSSPQALDLLGWNKDWTRVSAPIKWLLYSDIGGIVHPMIPHLVPDAYGQRTL